MGILTVLRGLLRYPNREFCATSSRGVIGRGQFPHEVGASYATGRDGCRRLYCGPTQMAPAPLRCSLPSDPGVATLPPHAWVGRTPTHANHWRTAQSEQ